MKRSSPCLVALLSVAIALLLACVPATPEPLGTKAPVEKSAGGGPAKPAQQTEWDKTVAAAKQEGKVTLYTSLGVEMRTILGEALNKTYGLELEMVSGRTLEVIAKMTAERRAGLTLADVYVGGSSSQITLKAEDMLQPMEPFLALPEVLDKKAWLDGELLFLDKARLILIFGSHVNTPVVINRDMVAPPIKTFKEMLDPKWKGKILMQDPSQSGAGNLFAMMVGEIHGEDFLRQLPKQEPAIVQDYRTHVEWVARGKYLIGTGPNPENINEFVKAGAPIAMPTLTDLSYTSSANGLISLLARPGHPNAAKVFVNWLLSKEGQTAFMKGLGSQSRRLDVTTEYTPPERIRQPGVKYINTESEELAQKRIYYQNVNKEIFGQFLK